MYLICKAKQAFNVSDTPSGNQVIPSPKANPLSPLFSPSIKTRYESRTEFLDISLEIQAKLNRRVKRIYPIFIDLYYY